MELFVKEQPLQPINGLCAKLILFSFISFTLTRCSTIPARLLLYRHNRQHPPSHNYDLHCANLCSGERKHLRKISITKNERFLEILIFFLDLEIMKSEEQLIEQELYRY